MASTRALAFAVVVGGLCGSGIYALVPAHPGGRDLHLERRVRNTLDRIDPTEAHVHGCVTQFGRPAVDTTVQLERALDDTTTSKPETLDGTGCYDLAVPYRLLGRLVVRVQPALEEPRGVPAELHHGDSVELGTLEVGTQLVRGVIRDRDGNRIAGVHVDGIRSTVHHASDDDGEYWLRLAATGRQTLHVFRYDHGFAEVDTEPVVVDLDKLTDDPITRDILLR